MMTDSRRRRQRLLKKAGCLLLSGGIFAMCNNVEALSTVTSRRAKKPTSATATTQHPPPMDVTEFHNPGKRGVLPIDSWASGSSALRMVCQDEQQEFELALGKALDTLRSDYPDILTSPPDFSIYHDELMVVDPAGVKLDGLGNYKNAFRLVHAIVDWFYSKENSLLTFRMVYDCTRNNIRVSWNAEVVPKKIFGGTKTTLHVDGVSVYEMDRVTAKIVQHRVEHLMINDMPVAPERGIFYALKKEVADPDFIPVFSRGANLKSKRCTADFQQWNPFNRKSLFQGDRSIHLTHAMASSANGDNDERLNAIEGLDAQAFTEKNEMRKKYGLKPLTPEEFMETEAQIRQMQVQERQRQASMSDATPAPSKKEKGGFLGKLFGDILEDTCENNWDCQRPEVCCDFGFKKMCCSSGAMVGSQRLEGAVIPVPQGIDDFPPGMQRRY